MGGKKKNYARSYEGGWDQEGPKGPPGGTKATSPPQELEVGARRAPYLLVCIYFYVRFAQNIYLKNIYFNPHMTYVCL